MANHTTRAERLNARYEKIWAKARSIPHIAKITKAYIRHYSDSGQTTAYVEWIGTDGKTGRTEGHCCEIEHRPLGWHMDALFNRARREGIEIKHETW